ncbi:MAG: chromate transporter [Bacteroidales bacterium]|nr:chromate transporter [Bacteroidales bacterium]
MTALFLQLFWRFFIIGLFTFGGGYAVIGIIQSELVIARGWISESAFTDIVAISQMTPGPVGLNCSTYVGYEVLKEAGASEFLASLGSLTASLAIVLPSFIIMLAIVKFYAKFHETPIFQSVLAGLRPAVAGLIGAAAVALMVNLQLGDGFSASIVASNFPDWKSWVLFAAAFAAYTFLKAGPMLLLGAGAIAGFFIYYLF